MAILFPSAMLVISPPHDDSAYYLCNETQVTTAVIPDIIIGDTLFITLVISMRIITKQSLMARRY